MSWLNQHWLGFVILWPIATYVHQIARSAFADIVRARRERQWLARQPKPSGHPFREGYPHMYEGSYRREPPPVVDLARCCCDHCCEVMKAKLSAAAPPRPAPTSLPGSGRLVRG